MTHRGCDACGNEYVVPIDLAGEWGRNYCEACRAEHFECKRCGDVLDLEDVHEYAECVCLECGNAEIIDELEALADEIAESNDTAEIKAAVAALKAIADAAGPHC